MLTCLVHMLVSVNWVITSRIIRVMVTTNYSTQTLCKVTLQLVLSMYPKKSSQTLSY